MYARATSFSLLSARRSARDAAKMRAQMRDVHATLSASPTEEYESATRAEVPAKKPREAGMLEK